MGDHVSWLIFAGDDYYPSMGVGDLVARASCLDVAKLKAEHFLLKNDWASILDTENLIHYDCWWKSTRFCKTIKWSGPDEVEIFKGD